MRNFVISKELLVDLYINQGKTIQEIADMYGVNRATISRNLKAKDIPTAHAKPVLSGHKNREEFMQVYKDVNYELKALAEHFGISYPLAHSWLQKHGVDRPTEPWKDRKMLEAAYKENSTVALGEMWGCAPATVRNWLMIYGITRRRRGMFKKEPVGPVRLPVVKLKLKLPKYKKEVGE